MTKMTSLARSDAERKEKGTLLCGPDNAEAPEYPYGTCLYLDEETLAKLGVTDAPAVGSTFTMTALVRVVATRKYEEESKDGEGRKGLSVDYQITDLSLDAGKASALYPSMRD